MLPSLLHLQIDLNATILARWQHHPPHYYEMGLPGEPAMVMQFGHIGIEFYEWEIRAHNYLECSGKTAKPYRLCKHNREYLPGLTRHAGCRVQKPHWI